MFQRDHNDLHCEMPISFTTAALGGDIEIPTLDGYAKIKIPAETQSGKVFRLRGKGIKGVRSSSHGDLLCHVVVETPVNLTARQRELLRGTRSDQQQGRGQAQSARQVVDGQGQGVLRGLAKTSCVRRSNVPRQSISSITCPIFAPRSTARCALTTSRNA